MNKHWLLLEFQHHLAKVSSLNLWYLCRRHLGICDDGHVNTVKVRHDAKFLLQQESHVPTPPSVAPSLCFFSAIFVSLVVRTQLLECAFPILFSHKIIWAKHYPHANTLSTGWCAMQSSLSFSRGSHSLSAEGKNDRFKQAPTAAS